MADRDTASLDRRTLWSWMIFDFANQPFTTLVVTFIYATFFTQVIAEDPVTGTSQWAWAVAVAGVLEALLAPYLGAMADRSGLRKRFLLITVVICVAGSVALFFPVSGQVWFALSAFVVANLAFELSYVFYNAFLPEIAPRKMIGRISGYGWAVGYLGGLSALVVALVVFVMPEVPPFGLDAETGEHIRATNILVAAWYAIFAIPLFLFVKETRRALVPKTNGLIRATNRQLRTTFHEIKRYRHAFWLLAARFFYNDGIVTIFFFGGIYAAETFGFETQDVLVFGIALNVAAGIGAFLFGFIDDWIGGKNTILITLVGLSAGCLVAVFTTDVRLFWAAGILIGLLVGPNQASSRSLLGRFIPPTKENEFFGFFAFSGKLTAFMGPLALGAVTALFESQRAGIATVLLFFLVGGLLLLKVNEAEGMEMSEIPPPAA